MRDPIQLFEAEMQQFGLIDDAGIAAVQAEVAAEIAAGIAFAQESPAPPVTDVLEYVYTEVRP
jgi:acetoin:2,6-dichlorophenolindophenol oxidoreductase subunit alpha